MNLFVLLVERWFISPFSLLTVASFLPPGYNPRTQISPANSDCRFSETLPYQSWFYKEIDVLKMFEIRQTQI